MRRIIIPDSHGHLIDKRAANAALAIIKHCKPDEIILLGDHVDCGGQYSRFDRIGLQDTYSSKDDFKAALSFIRRIREVAGRSTRIDYLEGNHEQHIERWAVNALREQEDIDFYLAKGSVPARLCLSDLGIAFHRRADIHDRMGSPGVIRREGCLFTHGFSHAKHATTVHLAAYNTSIVHGHIHRATYVGGRLATGEPIFGACPGTLAKLQPIYMHSMVSQHTHGIAFQEVAKQRLFHFNISIMDGQWKLP